MDTVEILSRLTDACGVSGSERQAAKAAAGLLKEYGEVKVCPVTGTVFCKAGSFDEARPTILLDAHIDEIGMIVTYITDEGFLKAAACGGIDGRALLAQRVTVYGRERLTGIVVSTPPHLEKDNTAAVSVDDIYIDVGMPKERAEKLIRPGDRALIETGLNRLCGGRVTSKALDNRAGAAVVLKTLELIKNRKTAFNVCAMLSAQEETGERGAKTGAYTVNADMAVVIDVSFAKTYGEQEENCGVLGGGPMIGIAPSLSSAMSRRMIDIAKEKGIPYQLEVMSGTTGTNADAIGVSRSGVMTVTVSVPEKHMHTPAEIVDIADIENSAALIAEFLESAGDINA